MRVLVAHTYYQQPGGEDRVFEAESALLEARGHEVIRYVVRNEDMDDLNKLEQARATFWNPHSYQTLSALLRDTQPELAHFHNTFPLMSASVYDACQKAGVPVVQTLHNYRLLCPAVTLFRNGQICTACVNETFKYPAVQHRCYRDSVGASAAVAGMLAYHSLRGTWLNKVNQYIAISDFVRDTFLDAGMPEDKITAKANSVEDIGLGQGGNYALFIGRLVPEKGVLTLLKAWQTANHDVPLKILGDGPLADQVKAVAAENPGVEYLGQQPKAATAGYLKNAAFVVFPSEWYEPFGLVIAEAFAAGTPVLAADSKSVQQLVSEQTGRFFRAGDPASLNEGVGWLVAHPEALTAMRVAARQTYLARFSQEQTYRSLLEIYTRVGAADSVPDS